MTEDRKKFYKLVKNAVVKTDNHSEKNNFNQKKNYKKMAQDYLNGFIIGFIFTFFVSLIFAKEQLIFDNVMADIIAGSFFALITYLLISNSAKKGLSWGTNFYEKSFIFVMFWRFFVVLTLLGNIVFLPIIYISLKPILIFLQVNGILFILSGSNVLGLWFIVINEKTH